MLVLLFSTTINDNKDNFITAIATNINKIISTTTTTTTTITATISTTNNNNYNKKLRVIWAVINSGSLVPSQVKHFNIRFLRDLILGVISSIPHYHYKTRPKMQSCSAFPSEGMTSNYHYST